MKCGTQHIPCVALGSLLSLMRIRLLGCMPVDKWQASDQRCNFDLNRNFVFVLVTEAAVNPFGFNMSHTYGYS